MDGLYGIEVELGVRRGPRPVQETPHRRVLAVDGEPLAVAVEQPVAELHHVPDAQGARVLHAPLVEKAPELAHVRLVELGRAGTGVRVVGEVGGEVLDQVVDPHGLF